MGAALQIGAGNGGACLEASSSLDAACQRAGVTFALGLVSIGGRSKSLQKIITLLCICVYSVKTAWEIDVQCSKPLACSTRLRPSSSVYIKPSSAGSTVPILVSGTGDSRSRRAVDETGAVNSSW